MGSTTDEHEETEALTEDELESVSGGLKQTKRAEAPMNIRTSSRSKDEAPSEHVSFTYKK